MHIIAKPTLQEYWEKHRDAEEALKAWYSEARHAKWKTPDDIKQRYSSADPLPGNRMVFNIKGNKYRLVVKINYRRGVVYIRWVGTHAQYDRINAETI